MDKFELEKILSEDRKKHQDNLDKILLIGLIYIIFLFVEYIKTKL